MASLGAGSAVLPKDRHVVERSPASKSDRSHCRPALPIPRSALRTAGVPLRAQRLGRSRSGRRRPLPGVVRAAYEPSPMDTSLLLPQLTVLGVIGVTGAYWWFVLVPSARVRLAVNKKSGALREYLEELKDDDSRPMEKWFYSNWLTKVDPETKYLLREEASENSENAEESPYVVKTTTKLEETGGVQYGKDSDDSLEDVIRKAKKTPKFWSGDNPVLVGTGISIAGAILFDALKGRL